MTKLKIDQLVWNNWNVEHVKMHGLTKVKVERAISKIVSFRYGYRGRIILICELSQKLVSIVVDRKGERKYYVVTARPADKKERRIASEKSK